MKRIILLISVVVCAISNLHAQTPVTNGSGFNHSSFTSEKKIITPELQALTDKKFYEHPEFGVLPYNAPCADCIELLQKRDETHRYFVKSGSKGKEFYSQTSYSHLNYKDENGVFHTIDTRIKPSGTAGVLKATQQFAPITVNIPERYTSILNDGKELQFNRDVNIFVMHKDGSVMSLGEANWTDYSAGDDGVVVHNIYAGIDLELKVGNGHIESFYRLNKPLQQLGDGWLVVRDNMKVPQGLVYDFTHSEKGERDNYTGTLFLNSNEGGHYFYIGTPSAYDINNEHGNTINLSYHITENGVYDLYVPTAWMNDSKRSYPLIIDPFVSATSTLPLASITGSSYDPVCFQNGCIYNLPVTVPPACVVSGMTYSFNYRALGTCNINQGAWDLSWGACHTPYQTCNIGLPGLCIIQKLSCYNDFQPCLSPPQCAAYFIPMTMTFYRCVQPGAPCAFSCVIADSAWTMTVTGRTLEIGSVATNNQTICPGSNANLSANATSGIPPYTYTWYPGGLVGDTVSVSPAATTTYTVIATCCGGADSAQATCTVTVGGAVKVSTQNASVCKGSGVNLTAVADSGAGAYNYTWYPGGLVGDTVSVSPDTTTTYTVVVTTCGGADAADSAQATCTVTVVPFNNYNPGFTVLPDTVCINNPVTLTGLGTGAPANYNWQLAGSNLGTSINSQVAYAIYSSPGTYNVILEYDSGYCITPDTQQVIVKSCVGIVESYLSDLFKVYPNPSEGSFTIQSDNIRQDNAELEIYNVLGERIYSFEINAMNIKSGYQLNLASASSGLYLLVLRAGNAVMGKKISIQK